MIEGIKESLSRVSIPHQIVGDPVMFDVVFVNGTVKDHRDILRSDAKRLKNFNLQLRIQNVLKLDSKFYISLALTEDDLSLTLNAVSQAARSLAQS